MKKSRELGMQTFDQSLFDLYEAGLITYEDALRNADSLNDLRLEIKLHGKEAKNRNVFAGIGNLDVVPESSSPTQEPLHKYSRLRRRALREGMREASRIDGRASQGSRHATAPKRPVASGCSRNADAVQRL